MRNSKALSERIYFKEVYVVNPPFASAGIEDSNGRLRYVVIEPILTDEEIRLLNRIRRILLEETSVDLAKIKDASTARKLLRDRVTQIIKDYKLKVRDEQLEKLMYYIYRDSLGYGKIDVLIKDPNIEDISIDGVNVPVYVWHKFYESIPTNIVLNEVELRNLISKLSYRVGKQVTISRPILDGLLPEGYRVHIALDQVSLRGGSLSIRKFSESPFTIIDLINFGTISAEVAAYLWILIENLRSIMICGSTAAGKTTLLNAVSMLIYPDSKVITIEEARELRLPHENWIPLVTRPAIHEGVEEITLFDLLKSALRQRPDYIIVGEIRGEEAYNFFQAIATGHGGMCSIHAENIDSAIKRLITKPMNVPLLLIPMMNVVALISRVKVGGKIVRRVTRVSEIAGVDEKRSWVVFNPVFEWTGEKEDSFKFTGKSFMFERIAEFLHRPVESIYEELENKSLILKWMVKKHLNRYDQVASVIKEYYRSRERFLRKVKMESALIS